MFINVLIIHYNCVEFSKWENFSMESIKIDTESFDSPWQQNSSETKSRVGINLAPTDEIEKKSM